MGDGLSVFASHYERSSQAQKFGRTETAVVPEYCGNERKDLNPATNPPSLRTNRTSSESDIGL